MPPIFSAALAYYSFSCLFAFIIKSIYSITLGISDFGKSAESSILSVLVKGNNTLFSAVKAASVYSENHEDKAHIATLHKCFSIIFLASEALLNPHDDNRSMVFDLEKLIKAFLNPHVRSKEVKLPDDFDEALDFLLSEFSEREQTLVRLRFIECKTLRKIDPLIAEIEIGHIHCIRKKHRPF